LKTLRILALAVGFGALWVISAAIAQLVINPPVSNVNINGHTWTNAMLQSNPAGWLAGVANDIGAVTALYPAGRFSPRVKLTAALDMYVNAASGSDSNNCLVGTPCRTIQRPFDLLRDGYDLANNTVTVHLADGSYTPGLKLRGKLLGQGDLSSLILLGNEASPQNVIIADPSTDASDLESGPGTPIFVAYGGVLSVRGVTLVAGFRSVWAHLSSTIAMRNIRFGPAGHAHIVVSQSASVRMVGDYSIYGGASCCHYYASTGQIIAYSPTNSQTVVHVGITNVPTFFSFAVSGDLGQILALSTNTIFSGAATTTFSRYFVNLNSIINTGGSGASYFPGSQPGVAQTGGIYQ
jgi:hypothetical protein